MTWTAEWLNERDLGYARDFDLLLTNDESGATERRSFSWEYSRFTVDQTLLDATEAAVIAELEAE